MWSYRLIWMLLVLLLLAVVWALLFSDHSYYTYRSEQEESVKLQQEILRLQQQRERLAQEILRLRNDPAALEQLVHERLGFVHPDEYIILHPEGGKP
ncbi:MAG: septum formation initiator family protein [Mariprofundales bacterium]|nr:septum formation initiator family protein [Mariprofundales bacterium]